MATTVNAALLIALLKDAPVAATAEACLQQSIRSINLEGLTYGVVLKELTGTTPNLTGTYTGAQAAGILQVAIAVYSQNYKNSGASSSSSESLGVGGMSMSNSSSSSNSTSGAASSLVSSLAHDVVMALKNAEGNNWCQAII
jgi:hypothetical protein